MSSRTFPVTCPKCGAKYRQDWEEPDECPNGCDDEEEEEEEEEDAEE